MNVENNFPFTHYIMEAIYCISRSTLYTKPQKIRVCIPTYKIADVPSLRSYSLRMPGMNCMILFFCVASFTRHWNRWNLWGFSRITSAASLASRLVRQSRYYYPSIWASVNFYHELFTRTGLEVTASGLFALGHVSKDHVYENRSRTIEHNIKEEIRCVIGGLD